MNYLRLTLLGLFLICSSSWASPQDGKIAAVESGLLPANVFKGDQPWTLQERMQHYGVPGVGIAVIHDSKVVWFKTYGWDGYEAHEILPVPSRMLNEYTGRYHFNAAIPVIVTSKQGGIEGEPR